MTKHLEVMIFTGRSPESPVGKYCLDRFGVTALYCCNLLAGLGIVREHLPQRAREIADADDTAIIQDLFSWVRDEEHKRFAGIKICFLFAGSSSRNGSTVCPDMSSRLERLSLHTTEVNTRLVLPNDFLFKVDTASMKESLEVRVPMLDEELFAFGLSLPHRLKVDGRTCKRVLRAIAQRQVTSQSG